MKAVFCFNEDDAARRGVLRKRIREVLA